MAIITQENKNEKYQIKNILHFAKTFRLAKILEQSNIRKAKGIGTLTVFIHLLSVAFSGKSLNRLLKDRDMEGKKDVFYRFMNSVSANWYKFIRQLSTAVIACILKTNPLEEIPVLILDDTLHKRDRSKNVELLTRVRDHNDGRYYRGFRCLTLGFHDGATFIPVDFRILSSQEEKTRINGMREDLDKRTIGYKTRKYAVCGSYDMALDMIGKQTKARHVLFDSWFSENKMFKKLLEMGMHGVGMLKSKKRVFCRYKGKEHSLENLYAQVKNMIHKDNDFVTVGVELLDGTPFSVTFVRDRQNKREWLAIGTTDLSLSGQQIISLYGRRWNIEVFFKTVKSFLGFAKECQSRSFDAVVCSVAVVFTRYIILAWLNNGAPERETYGQLFFRLVDEMRVCTFSEALELVTLEIKKLFVQFHNTLDLSLRFFIESLPPYFQPLKGLLSCET